MAGCVRSVQTSVWCGAEAKHPDVEQSQEQPFTGLHKISRQMHPPPSYRRPVLSPTGAGGKAASSSPFTPS